MEQTTLHSSVRVFMWTFRAVAQHDCDWCFEWACDDQEMTQM